MSVTGFVWAQQPVTAVVDGRSTAIRTQARTVAEFLAENGVEVGERDVVTPSPDSRITAGMTVLVRHAVPVTIRLGGEEIELAVVGSTVADALVAVGIDPSDNLAVSPSLAAPLEDDMVITAPDVFVRVDRQSIALPPETVERETVERPLGERVVVDEGSPGVKLRVWRTVVTRGRAGERVLSEETVVTEPAPRVVEVGAAGTIKQLLQVSHTKTVEGARPGADEGRRLSVLATGYTAGEPGVNHHTATGDRVRHGVIAVDPRVIPLGTRLYVPGYGYGVAADVGGMIKGNHIDLYFDSHAGINGWGKRTVEIVVLD